MVTMSDWTADPFLAGCSGRKGCRVGSEGHHVVDHQVGDIWLASTLVVEFSGRSAV